MKIVVHTEYKGHIIETVLESKLLQTHSDMQRLGDVDIETIKLELSELNRRVIHILTGEN